MDIKLLGDEYKDQYNHFVTHVVQSWEWGEFRQKLGLPLHRYGIFNQDQMVSAFQLTLHKIPFFNKFLGYLPKGPLPDEDFIKALSQVGKEQNCAAIKIEPDILNSKLSDLDLKSAKNLKVASKPLFTKYNFLIDLSSTEEEILAKMHPKTRYNIKIAQKHEVLVEERVDDEAFEIYLKLYFQTTNRQKYHGHNPTYHRLLWETLKSSQMARILIAFYTPPETNKKIPLTAWMLFNFKDTLYYPYGGSSEEYRNVMSSNLVAWEAIKLGKRLNLKSFDLWGALPPDAPQNHPWQGFNRFKAGFGGELVEYIGSFDLIFNPLLFTVFNKIDKYTSLKVLLLKLIGK